MPASPLPPPSAPFLCFCACFFLFFLFFLVFFGFFPLRPIFSAVPLFPALRALGVGALLVPAPPPSLSLFVCFLFPCGVCAVCCPPPPSPRAAPPRVLPCLASCCVAPRSVVGWFVWFVVFGGVFLCHVVLVSCYVVLCRAVLLVLSLEVSPGRCFPLFLLVSCGALLCRAVLCGALSCVVPSRIVVWCVVLCVVLVHCLAWSLGPLRCVGFSFPVCQPPLLLPHLAVAWSPVVARCGLLSWGAVLFCCAACRVVRCCLRRFVLAVPRCFVRAGWCRVLLPVVAGCLLLGLVAHCCFPLACFVAGAPAWPCGLLPCCVLWFVVAPRLPVLCTLFCGAVLPVVPLCGALLSVLLCWW